MLIGQNFGRRHHTCLITVVKCNKHTHQRHKRLSATHIALQQAVHLPAHPHVATDFLQHPLLGIGQFERKIFGIKRIEYIAYFAEHISPILALPVACITQNVELYIEQFFKLQPILRLTQQFGTGREVYVYQRFGQRHQMMFAQYGRRQRLGQRIRKQFHHRSHHFLDSMGVERTALHFLRRIIIRTQPHRFKFQIGHSIHIRMGYVYTSVENRRLSKDDVFLTDLIFSYNIFHPLKPDQVHHSRSVGEMSHQSSVASFAHILETQDLTLQLYVRHVAIQLVYTVYTAPVYIFIREIIQ